MKVARMSVRRLEAGAAFTEIDLARDACVDHPLQRAVHGCASDARRLRVHTRDEVVRTQVSFLAQEHVNDAISLGRSFAARGN